MSIFTSGKQGLKFYMAECDERAKTVQLIENYGGRLVKKPKPDAITLVPYDKLFEVKADTAKPQLIYSYKLIEESINYGNLQDLSEYKINVKVITKSEGRVKYSKEDEAAMAEHARTHPGKKNSVRYWEIAISSGLTVKHSAESLKHHWCHYINSLKAREESTPAKKEQANYSFVSKKKERVEINLTESTPRKKQPEELKTPHSFSKTKMLSQFDSVKSKFSSARISDAFDNPNDICIIVGPSGRRVVDYRLLETKAEESNVHQSFEFLIRRCCEVSGKALSEKEVLAQLLAEGGDMDRTILTFNPNLR